MFFGLAEIFLEQKWQVWSLNWDVQAVGCGVKANRPSTIFAIGYLNSLNSID
jgi:hypothetical protein